MASVYCADLTAPREKLEPEEQVQQLFKFLQGDLPEGVFTTKREQPKLSAKQAFTVIWFLQEHLHLLLDNFEQCCTCKKVFDSHSEGYYIESVYRHYCDNCIPSRYCR